MPQSRLHISSQENSIAWKKQNLQTASEPSTLSFAHYITGSFDPLLSETDAALRSSPFELGLGLHSGNVLLTFLFSRYRENAVHSAHGRSLQHQQQEAG